MFSFNPLGMRVGGVVRIDDDPNTQGLRFTVTALAQYTVHGPNWQVQFLDVTVEAPCTNPANEYAYEGKVRLTIRVLKNERNEIERVLLWEESPEYVADIASKAGSLTLSHAFGDGLHTYHRLSEQGEAPFEAEVLIERMGEPQQNAGVVRCWTYQRPWIPAAGAPEISMYLMIEEWPDEGVWLRRGYDLLASSMRVG